ncbi:ScbR family autoregulator-binding transcription factor [Streptomyces sp. NPDC002888]|uniref:ScbR family autoregulator-binding transcription factor n=1 Tax=Streptomyces sp. NPDC002888 TaxID=3364668 RepID=UPI00368DB53B
MSRQERAVHTRNALLRSAAELFDQHGYARTLLSEISSAAGVSTGALHFHFESKAALAEAVEDAAARTLRAAARWACQDQPNVLQALTDSAHVFARLLHQDIIVRAGFQLACDPSRRSGLNLLEECRGWVRNMLDRAARQGALAPGASPQDLAAALVATMTGLEVLSRDNEKWLSRSALTDVWCLVLPGVTSPRGHKTVDPAGTDSAVRGVGALSGGCQPAAERSSTGSAR